MRNMIFTIRINDIILQAEQKSNVPHSVYCLCKTKVEFFGKVSAILGCVKLYSDVSEVGNVKKPGRHFDKRDKISAWLNF